MALFKTANVKFKKMKAHVQFLIKSTRYIAGSIPPQFSKEHVKPIDLLGSDGVKILDGRYSLDTCINVVHEIWGKHLHKNQIIGFEIKHGPNFTNNRVLYRYIQPGWND